MANFENTRSGITITPVDFETEDLIYVIDTEKPHTTYKLKTVSVVEFSNRIEIKVKSEQQNEGGGLNINVRPYTVIKNPKTNKAIVCKYVK
ncbi:hypothetical protein AB4865_01365 [Capnocytophaga sp. ARDL2]|uniref:hypothetical protein n=1 Tax=Capnocytophaga sp. ARDL2 TaxID=3238809 RepID=UPI0035566130